MKRLILICITIIAAATAKAQQCGIENTAFQSGEQLTYDLYFNWQFVWVKVGKATMTTNLTTYQGKPAWQASLVTGGNSKLDKFFTMRDTLLSYCSTNLSPLYFRKGALEGKRYYIDELWYTYPQNKCSLRMHRVTHKGEHLWKNVTYRDCIYDMMSIFLRARNFDAATLKEGDVIAMPISDAKSLSHSWLKYRGKENFKTNGKKEKFRCLVFSFIEHEDGKNNELIRFYITDDANHIPVRLDMFLRFGSAKAFVVGIKGNKNPIASIVK